MRSVTVVIMRVVLVQAHVKERVAYHMGNARDIMDKWVDNLVSKLVCSLLSVSVATAEKKVASLCLPFKIYCTLLRELI